MSAGKSWLIKRQGIKEGFLGALYVFCAFLPVSANSSSSLPDLSGVYEGEIRWWLDTGWTHFTWVLAARLIMVRFDKETFAWLYLTRTDPFTSASNSLNLSLPIVPESSLFAPPEKVAFEISPVIENGTLFFTFSYEDPITWLDVKVEASLQVLKGRMVGVAKGVFLQNHFMKGVVNLYKIHEKEVIGRNQIISR